ncbi:MAG: hypothetical protein HY788_23960 [Deltaproteobacteria bacterium]|nr:hypothetical protein [Deltaproteobacteria bacterium]
MNRALRPSRKKGGIALAGILAYVATLVLGGWGAFVSCYGSEGHAGIESLQENFCGHPLGAPLPAGLSPGAELQQTHVQCGTCVDIPLSGQVKLPSKADVVSQSRATVHLAAVDLTKPFPTHTNGLRSVPLAFRTVILLI